MTTGEGVLILRGRLRYFDCQQLLRVMFRKFFILTTVFFLFKLHNFKDLRTSNTAVINIMANALL